MDYQFRLDTDGKVCGVRREKDFALIPLNMMNGDCTRFVREWASGAVVLNADGSAAPYSDAALQALF